MKIITNTLEGITGIELYPIIGLIIFLVFFIILIIRVIHINQDDENEFSHLPLDSNDSFMKEPKNHVN